MVKFCLKIYPPVNWEEKSLKKEVNCLVNAPPPGMFFFFKIQSPDISPHLSIVFPSWNMRSLSVNWGLVNYLVWKTFIYFFYKKYKKGGATALIFFPKCFYQFFYFYVFLPSIDEKRVSSAIGISPGSSGVPFIEQIRIKWNSIFS